MQNIVDPATLSVTDTVLVTLLCQRRCEANASEKNLPSHDVEGGDKRRSWGRIGSEATRVSLVQRLSQVATSSRVEEERTRSWGWWCEARDLRKKAKPFWERKRESKEANRDKKVTKEGAYLT